MKVSYRNGIYKLEKRDFILDELVIKLDMCERRKEILFEGTDKDEVALMEANFIQLLQSNQPSIGYNKTLRKHRENK